MNITKISLLLDLRDYYSFQAGQHAANYMLKASKPGHETHFNESKQRLTIIDELILEAEEAA